MAENIRLDLLTNSVAAVEGVFIVLYRSPFAGVVDQSCRWVPKLPPEQLVGKSIYIYFYNLFDKHQGQGTTIGFDPSVNGCCCCCFFF